MTGKANKNPPRCWNTGADLIDFSPTTASKSALSG